MSLIAPHAADRLTVTNNKSLGLRLGVSHKLPERYKRAPKASLTDTNTGRPSPVARCLEYIIAKNDTQQPWGGFADVAYLYGELCAHRRRAAKPDTWSRAVLTFMRESSRATRVVLSRAEGRDAKKLALLRVGACLVRLAMLVDSDAEGPSEELMFQLSGRGK
jgi:hypothetical protein